MLVDRLLDGDSAGHRGLVAHQRRCSTQREARQAPDRREQGGPHAASGGQFVEGGIVLALRAGHAGDLAAGFAVGPAGPAQRRELALVYAHRTEFARLVDADHALDELARIGIAGVAPFTGFHVPVLWSARGCAWRPSSTAGSRHPPTGSRSSRPSRCPTSPRPARRSAPSWRRRDIS